MTEVMSLAEWTAASARPSATAASTSVTKTPCPPIWSSGAVSVVALRAHDHHLNFESPVGGPQGVGNRVGLAQRQRRPAGGQAERLP
jgi:hypothetical protein